MKKILLGMMALALFSASPVFAGESCSECAKSCAASAACECPNCDCVHCDCGHGEE